MLLLALIKYLNLKNILKPSYIYVFLLFFALCFFHVLEYPSFGELEDIARFLIFICSLDFSKYISFRLVDSIFIWLTILNLIAVQYFESGDILGLSQNIHARDLESSCSDPSGLFVNVVF